MHLMTLVEEGGKIELAEFHRQHGIIERCRCLCCFSIFAVACHAHLALSTLAANAIAQARDASRASVLYRTFQHSCWIFIPAELTEEQMADMEESKLKQGSWSGIV